MKDQIKILLVDDDESGREPLTLLLKRAGFVIKGASTGHEALQLLSSEPFNIVITDLFLPDSNGIDILKEVKRLSANIEVILITGFASAETAVQAMKEGAFDYITKPVNFEELKLVLAKAIEKNHLVNENVYLKKQLRDKYEFSNIIGSSPAMQQVFNLLKRVIKTESTVLIMGESGTGKEVVAKAIHFNSTRKAMPFVAVHCGAIPENLLESELFGYVRGAFTGANKDKIGKFEAANGGTIFLDEIGTMPLQLQTKLLRVLQEHEVERVGSHRTIKLDVRVISATNNQLEEEVKQGRFREDLYWRLNVIPINLPPLRERIQDILPLARHFLAKYCQEMNRPLMTLSKESLESLEINNWPGNVRQLENVIERIVALTEANQISLSDLPPNISGTYREPDEYSIRVPISGIDLTKTVNRIEMKMIDDALTICNGVKAQAATLLSLNRTTLVEKMRRLGMQR